MASPTLRIAVLECDPMHPSIRAAHGGYTQLFQRLFESAADQMQPRPRLKFSGFDVVEAEEYPNLAEVEAIIISGSQFSSYGNDDWITKLLGFVRVVLAHRQVRIIGVCFGHQIATRALAGDLAVGKNSMGWEVGVTEVELNPKGREVFGMEKMVVHQMHQDIVNRSPISAESLGCTEKCKVQSIYIPRRLLTVQGHPEFDAKIASDVLHLKRTSGTINEAVFTDGMKSVEKPHDGVAIAQAFLKFLLSN